MSPVDELRRSVRSRVDRRNFFAAAAVGNDAAADVVTTFLSPESLGLGKPAPSDVPPLVESLAAGDPKRLRDTARTWPSPAAAADSPWFTAAWSASLRHLDPEYALSLHEGGGSLADERSLINGHGDSTPISFVETARGAALAVDVTTRRLANRPLTETSISASDLGGTSTGWLRVLRGRFELLADDTIDFVRSRLDGVDPDPYEIALIVEVSRAKSFGLDEIIAERLLALTDQGARSFNGFEAILTLLTDWVVP